MTESRKLLSNVLSKQRRVLRLGRIDDIFDYINGILIEAYYAMTRRYVSVRKKYAMPVGPPRI